jgi:hypothetical protein
VDDCIPPCQVVRPEIHLRVRHQPAATRAHRHRVPEPGPAPVRAVRVGVVPTVGPQLPTARVPQMYRCTMSKQSGNECKAQRQCCIGEGHYEQTVALLAMSCNSPGNECEPMEEEAASVYGYTGVLRADSAGTGDEG